jgi:ABC-2 type transport system ATP-binding protein
MMSHGYVVAEGQIQGVRNEIQEHPSTILVRCDRPALVAQRLFEHDHVVEARISEPHGGILVRTRNTEAFYSVLNRIIVDEALVIEGVLPTDDDVNSVYNYLIGAEGAGS